MIDYNKLKSGYLNKPDVLRSKAERAFGDLVNPKRAAIQESQGAKDSTPVRKYAAGGVPQSKAREKNRDALPHGAYKKGGPVVNEKRHNAPMKQGVRQDGKLYAGGGWFGEGTETKERNQRRRRQWQDMLQSFE